ncbi:MAG: hypothetical protein CMN30_04645 [Sandaracinus sp.]|nr:hypothetical protein [Sandaracinus sp.]
MHAVLAVGFATLAASTLAPCATPAPEPPVESVVAGRETPSDPRPAAETEPPTETLPLIQAPPPDPTLVRADPRIHSPLDPAMAERLRALRAEGDHRDDVFVKLGGSSVESRAFLHCFAYDGDNLDLADHQATLGETLEFFRGGNAGGSNPFSRESLAAQVGWSLRQGLAGRPSKILQEARATDGRFALLFFGGNDVQARRPRSFGERLEQAIEQLVQRGIVPIVGANSPRGDDPEMDYWARRYNRISRGLAAAWRIPYVDFHLAQMALPGMGLAGDGVHPNTLLDGGRGRACVLSAEGLERGSNQRNLLTLEALDRMRRVVVAGEDAPDPAPAALAGAGTAAEPIRLTRIPFAERLEPAGEGTLTAYGCEGAEPAPGRERVYRVHVEETTALEVNVFADQGARTYLLGPELNALQCRAHGEEDLEVTLERGVHYLVVEVAPDQEAPVTVLIDEQVPRGDD